VDADFFFPGRRLPPSGKSLSLDKVAERLTKGKGGRVSGEGFNPD
jgi:hypothetical protein